MQKLICKLISIFLIAANFAVAENPDLTQPLKLDQCIEIALQNSSDMKNARTNLKIQDLQIKNAKAAYYPDLFLNGNYSAADRLESWFERENYYLSVTGNITVWDYGRRKTDLLKANENKRSLELRESLIRQNLIFQVTQSYYELLKAKDLVEVDLEILERSRDNRKRVEAFVEAGSQIEADIATAQVREANDELSLLNDRNQLAISSANLPRAMGLDPNTVIEIAESSAEVSEIEAIAISLEEAITQAIEKRSEIAELKSQTQQLEFALRLAKLERFPTINAEFRNQAEISEFLHDTDGKYLRDWQFTTSLNFAIFDGGVIKRRVKELTLQIDRQNEDLADLKRSISLEVQQAYLNLKRAEKAIEISETLVRNAKLSLDVTRERYDLGESILIELLDAQTEYARALTNQVRAFYDYQITRSALKKAMGIL